jgi:hypothetical protein
MEYFVKFYQCVVVTSLERHRVTVWTLIWWHLLLNRNLCKKSYYFNFGSRKEQIIFARLRLKCSSLKDHLFQKNIIDEILSMCGCYESGAS